MVAQGVKTCGLLKLHLLFDCPGILMMFKIVIAKITISIPEKSSVAIALLG